MKRKVAACYLKKGMAYCLMGAMLLGLSIGTAGCGKEQKGTQEAEGNTEIQEVEGNDGPIEIVYWNQWTQEDETAFLKKYVEEYNSSQDKYHVSFLAIPYEEYTTTKLATAFATNEAPDIFECSPAIINQYLDAGVCEPLDDIITDEIRNDFTDAALWPLLFLTIYEVTAQNCISEVSLFRILKITKIVCLGYSFVLVIEHILGIIPGTSEMFPTYVLLALVPFSLYEMDMEHGIKFNVIYLICTFLIMLMTSKRSCILVLAVGIMGYFLVKAKVQGRNVKAIVNRMAKYILAILVIFLAMYFVTKLMKLDIVERLNEMLNGDTNGRSAIWENVLEAFNASTLSEKLIGHGYHAFRFYKYSGYMYILNGNLAHNDYLNTLYDYGIIGVAVYASFLLSMIKELLLLIKKKSEIAPAFTFSIVLLGFLTFVSYFGIESRIINYVAIFWGYTLAIKRFDIKN